MGELRPLAGDLQDDCREFAQALRGLFGGLDVSVRRYAARRYRDAGTVSRYLSGVRVPPWTFVEDLCADLAADRRAAADRGAAADGGVPSGLPLDRLRELHGRALRATERPAPQVELLQQQLAAADREARRATADEDLLGGALLERQHRIADLEARLKAPDTGALPGATAPGLPVPRREGGAGLVAERRRLAGQVAALEAELEEARLRVMLAESRCDVLERQLAIAEGPLPVLAGPPSGTGPAWVRASGPDGAGEPEPGAEPPWERSGAGPLSAGEGPRPEEAPTGPGDGQPAARILAVDDKRANLLALEAVLSGLGHEIVTADSGQAALRALMDATGFAVILLDVQMPDMDGYETALHIKRRPRTRNIPIIFLTAMDEDPSHMFRGYTAGAVDYLIKPFEPRVLRAKVEAFVQMHLEARSGH